MEAAWMGGKPAGHVFRFGKTWTVRFVRGPRNDKVTSNQNFRDKDFAGEAQTEAHAREWRKQESDRLGLTKNMYRLVQDHVEVQLCNDKIMLIDLEDLPLVEAHVWTWYQNGYAFTAKAGLFHKAITGYDMTDHINRVKLDNRKKNLRPADPFINSRNMSMFKTNTSGINGVRREPKKEGRNGQWAALWCEEGKVRRVGFSVKEYGEDGAKKRAADFRQEVNKRLKITNGLPPTI